MSFSNSAGESLTPRARWYRVPAAGIKPEDNAVEPRGTLSRSNTTTSAPASCAASAAIKPHAPAPITATDIGGGNKARRQRRGAARHLVPLEHDDVGASIVRRQCRDQAACSGADNRHRYRRRE